MDPITIGLLGGSAISSIIGGFANMSANMSAAERAKALQDRDLQDWLKINIPDPRQQKIAMQRFVSTGEINPVLEQAIAQDPSAFEKIRTSQAQKAAQMRALSEIEKVGLEGGMRLQDKAALQDAMMQAQVADRGSRQAIDDEFARRGALNSGFAYQGRLQNQQATGDRMSRAALSAAAQAQDRALQALQSSGELATKYRNQDFDEQARVAAAQDAIKRFNTSNLQDVQQRNVAMMNDAQAKNLANRQRIADLNVNLANDEQKYNSNLIQQQFENQLARQRGISAGRMGQAQTEMSRGQAMGNFYSNLGNAASGAFTALGEKRSQDDFWDKYFASENAKAAKKKPTVPTSEK